MTFDGSMIERLRRTIERARGGDDDAIDAIRTLAVRGFMHATADELIELTELLCDLKTRGEQPGLEVALI